MVWIKSHVILQLFPDVPVISTDRLNWGAGLNIAVIQNV